MLFNGRPEEDSQANPHSNDDKPERKRLCFSSEHSSHHTQFRSLQAPRRIRIKLTSKRVKKLRRIWFNHGCTDCNSYRLSCVSHLVTNHMTNLTRSSRLLSSRPLRLDFCKRHRNQAITICPILALVC